MYNRKAYIICFDKGGVLDMFDYKGLKEVVKTAEGILNCWHYLESTYIIITESNISASDVADFFRAHLINKHFLVSEVNLINHNGWLPEKAWDWINKNK